MPPGRDWGPVTALPTGATAPSRVSLFDKHRHSHGEHGGCLDPAGLRNGRTGAPLAVLGENGVWSSPPMPPEEVARRQAARARR